MTQKTFVRPEAIEMSGTLFPAPVVASKTIQGHKGLILSKERLADGRLIVIIGIAAPGGDVIGAKFDEHSFQSFCFELTRIFEAENLRGTKIWEGETIQ